MLYGEIVRIRSLKRTKSGLKPRQCSVLFLVNFYMVFWLIFPRSIAILLFVLTKEQLKKTLKKVLTAVTTRDIITKSLNETNAQLLDNIEKINKKVVDK